MNSTVADAELDISFPADSFDEETAGRRPPEVPVFSDGKTWSSLAAVLLLHAAVACVLWVSPKPHDSGHKWIEVRLVSMQGGAETTGPGMQGGLEAGGGEQPATVTPPANQELLNSRLTTENERTLPAAPKNNFRPTPHPKKAERTATHPKDQKEIRSVQPVNPAQTESGANQSEGSGQGAGTGAGTAGGSSDQGVAGGKNAPGGAGPAEWAFGSPGGPSFLRKVLPCYPAIARKLEKEGTVLLRVTIDERGRPVEIEIIKKAGFGFDEEAVKAVKDSTFVPAKKEGKPLTCKALLPIRFVLKQS
ncbi:MAG: TonB family protein [Syntrophobacteraceae bacterium]|jgi:protein TonB